MKAIFHRLRRLENTTAPAQRERTAAEAIMAARRRRLGPDYEPVRFPPESYAGCRSTVERILRARELRMEQGVADSKRGIAAGGAGASK
jgi:hypothetical protein